MGVLSRYLTQIYKALFSKNAIEMGWNAWGVDPTLNKKTNEWYENKVEDKKDHLYPNTYLADTYPPLYFTLKIIMI